MQRQLVCLLWDNDKRALKHPKAKTHKSPHMMGEKKIASCILWKSWPWIVVLHLATRIKGNLEQTHFASRDRGLFCLSFNSKNAKQGYFSKLQSPVIDREGERRARGWSSFFLFSFCVKSRSSWRATKLGDFHFSVTFQKPGLIPFPKWPPVKLLNSIFFNFTFLTSLELHTGTCQDWQNLICGLDGCWIDNKNLSIYLHLSIYRYKDDGIDIYIKYRHCTCANRVLICQLKSTESIPTDEQSGFQWKFGIFFLGPHSVLSCTLHPTMHTPSKWDIVRKGNKQAFQWYQIQC